jgi:transposase InsO family protein
VRPDPDKVQALADFPEPQNRKELKGFVGLVSWLRKFLPELNEHLSAFRPLLKDRTPWIWTATEKEAFQAVKTDLAKIAPLMMLRAGEPLILAVDASSFGLGAALLQKDKDGIERPVYFASRLLNEAEKTYPQIDKEFLAIVWALERLDAFVYGQSLTIRTDHRPLIGIMKKSMAHMSTRQQRFVARAMRYTFSLQFVPGREMFVADFLSRSVDKNAPECRCMMMGTDIRLEDAFVSMLTSLPISDELTERIKNDATQDAAYQAAIRAQLNDFPPRDATGVGEYWAERNEYVVEDGLLYYQSRVVIPRPARQRLIDSLHRGHVALATMMKRARETVWWPGMVNDLKMRASRCAECQNELPMQRREPMLSFEVPPAPGLVIHSDYFELTGKEYVLFVDRFSGWTEVATAASRRPAELIRLFRAFMSRNGVPPQFHSDQGSPYTSNEFQQFRTAWGIRVTAGSPKHQRGNAIAEAYVKKVKHILRTARDDDEIARALLAMHQTPLANGRPSPAQLHLGRNVRDELHPQVTAANVSWAEMREWKQALAEERKKHFDRGTGVLHELGVGELVLVRHKDRWQRGVISAVQDRPRSYTVRLCESGQVLQRNRHLLRRIDPASTKPQVQHTNPSSMFQVRPPTASLRLLTVTVNPATNERTTPRLPNPTLTSPDHSSSSPAPSTSPDRRNATPPPREEGNASPQSTFVSPQSARSSRSYASILQTPSPESQQSGNEVDPGSSPESSSAESSPGTPPPMGKGARARKPPDRWSPEPFRRYRR